MAAQGLCNKEGEAFLGLTPKIWLISLPTKFCFLAPRCMLLPPYLCVCDLLCQEALPVHLGILKAHTFFLHGRLPGGLPDYTQLTSSCPEGPSLGLGSSPPHSFRGAIRSHGFN